MIETLSNDLHPLHDRNPKRRDGAEPCVELAIADEGPGLRAEDVAQIFNPFYTTRRTGTGLGLTVAHRIMEDHGGYIEVAPQAHGERGTTFVIGFRVEGSAEIQDDAGERGHGEDPGS